MASATSNERTTPISGIHNAAQQSPAQNAPQVAQGQHDVDSVESSPALGVPRQLPAREATPDAPPPVRTNPTPRASLVRRVKSWIVAHPYRTAAVVIGGILTGASFAIPGLPMAIAVIGVIAWAVHAGIELANAARFRGAPETSKFGDSPKIRCNGRYYLSSSSSEVSDDDHKAFALEQVRSPTAEAGQMEVEALAKALKVDIKVWRRPDDQGEYYQLLPYGAGDQARDLPKCHLVSIRNRHYTEFQPENRAEADAAYVVGGNAQPIKGRSVERGGRGDCFYLAVLGALPEDHPQKQASVAELRDRTANELQNSAPHLFRIEAGTANDDAAGR